MWLLAEGLYGSGIDCSVIRNRPNVVWRLSKQCFKNDYACAVAWAE